MPPTFPAPNERKMYCRLTSRWPRVTVSAQTPQLGQWPTGGFDPPQAFSEPRSGTELVNSGRTSGMTRSRCLTADLDALGFKPKREFTGRFQLATGQIAGTATLTTLGVQEAGHRGDDSGSDQGDARPTASGMSNGRRVVASAISALGGTRRPFQRWAARLDRPASG